MENILTQIQAHLKAGGKVVVATYARATQYGPKHVDMFRVSPRDGSLQVQRGKYWDSLSAGGSLLVGIRLV